MTDKYEEKLERRMKRERRYKGHGNYTGAFGMTAVFSFIGVLSIVFNILNIDFINIKTWGYWMFIPAFFICIGGISTYIKYKRLKAETLAILEGQTGLIKLDALAQELMMERPSLLRLLLDLRVERLLKFRVDAKSGDLILGETYIPAGTPTTPEAHVGIKYMFCPHCGKSIADDSIFCPNCGAAIQ
ncbi:MAG: zinc ribbon domain-containing protein [Candidatus Helarchaeota archaeon]